MVSNDGQNSENKKKATIIAIKSPCKALIAKKRLAILKRKSSQQQVLDCNKDSESV